MTVRWQTGELRSVAAWLDDADGAPLLGAVVSALARRKDTGAALAAPAVSELGDGFYRIDLTNPPSADVLVLVTSGDRRVPLEVEVGGWPDQVDVAVSSRASAASVAALGAPAQADALAALDDAVAALHVAMGTPVQTYAVAEVMAAVVALGSPVQEVDVRLDRLDVAVSSRATAADVQSASRTFGGELR